MDRVRKVTEHLENNKKKRVCLVVGAGDYLGGSIAVRFARENYHTVICRRKRENLRNLEKRITLAGGEHTAFGCDARKEDQVIDLFSRIEREIGPIEVLIFNIGANVKFTIRETTSRVFRKVWEMGCFAGFLSGREAAKFMVPRGRGTIIFTGATASLRGAKGFAAFSAAKAGLRMVAQSMARELGSKGVHVAHVVIDGPIDTAWIRENFPVLVKSRPKNGILNPDHIAETYWRIHCQEKSAWTFEIDVRPYIEPW